MGSPDLNTSQLKPHQPNPANSRIEGLGIIAINGVTGEIRAFTEQTGKAATNRRPGEVSIPLETRKANESAYGNFTGALAEAYGDTYVNDADAREALRRSVLYAGNYSFHPGFETNISGRLVVCRLAVIVDRGDGSTDDIPPHASNEAKDPRWVDPSDFFKPGTRQLAQLAVEHALRTGIYNNLLNLYRNNPGTLRPVFPERFSIRHTYNQRERLRDAGR